MQSEDSQDEKMSLSTVSTTREIIARYTLEDIGRTCEVSVQMEACHPLKPMRISCTSEGHPFCSLAKKKANFVVNQNRNRNRIQSLRASISDDPDKVAGSRPMWQQWIRQLNTFLHASNGSVVEGLKAWKGLSNRANFVSL